MNKTLSIAVATCLIVLFMVYIFDEWIIPYDDTDDVANGIRSGLVLRTDHGTGCQYLLTPGFLGIGSHITPRLDENGNQVCAR